MSGRVAVIAVHGVADQPPFATARAAADLLKCRLAGEASEFHEDQLRVEVQPLRGPIQAKGLRATQAEQHEPATRQRERSTLWQMGVELECDKPREAADDQKHSGIAQAAGAVPEGAASRDQADQEQSETILRVSREASSQYFAAQISEYRQQPVDAVYDTVCLSSTIRGKQVDVHEMYWADLSRVRSGFFQAVEELYYVLFAVCNIGRMELDRSKSLFTDWRWNGLRWCEAIAERILTLFVPLGNACLLLLLVFTLPHLLPDCIRVEHWTFLAPAGFGVGLLAGVSLFALFFSHRPAGAALFLVLGGVGGLAAGSIAGLLLHPVCIRIGLSVLLWFFCALVLYGLSGRFNNRQPGARRVSLILGGLVLFPVFGEAIHRAPQEKFWALDIGLATAEWVLIGLMAMWFVYLVAAAACSWLGRLAVRRERKSSPRRKTAERIVWTANLAILAPGILCIVLNLGIWQALYTIEGYLIPKFIPAALKHQPACPYSRWLHGLIEVEKRAGLHCPTDADIATTTVVVAPWTDAFSIEADRVPGLLIRNSAQPMFVALAALVLMLLSAAWLLLPAILSEGTTASDPNQMYARQLGNSLSFAWRGLRWCAEPFVRWQLFVLIAVCVGIGLADRLMAVTGFDLKYWLFVLSGPALWSVGWLFVALATGILQYAYLRTVVDVAADVANWLRLHPRDDNPTSRISARYVSLLRYVAQRKDVDGDWYYDRVVIFAHSLGSAITADLLQFLQKYPDDGLARINDGSLPIHLFTQGCPLRQLLGLRLPITYGWAWHGSRGWDYNEEPIGQELRGVVKWVNAYCSGDYVGRYLWHDDVSDTPWDSTRHEKSGAVPRVELCVGAGAHTHYWDPDPQAANGRSTAPSTKVADELWKLIE